MAVSKRLRYEVLKRDGNTCRNCGAKAPDVKLEIDHVVPVTLGGSDDPSNLVTLCMACNRGKSSVPADAPLVADVAADALRWARAMERAAEEIAAEEGALEDICEAVARAWSPRWMPTDYRSSVYSLIKSGLTQTDLVELVGVALNARGVDERWAYFCGCGWKRVKKLQERATDLIAFDATVSQSTPESLPLLPSGNYDYLEPGYITGKWTEEDVNEVVTQNLAYARQHLTPEQIDHISCTHCSVGSCGGDPICRLEHSTAAAYVAIGVSNESFYQEAVARGQ